MPPLGWFPAGVAATALFAVLTAHHAAGRARDAIRDGWLFGVAMALGNGWWIHRALNDGGAVSGVVAMLASVVWVGSTGGIAAAVLRAASRRGWPLGVALPVAWTAGEWVIANAPEIGMPWIPLALSVAQRPVLAQAAELSGPSGVSFMLAAAGGLAAHAWLAWRRAAPRVAWRAGAGALAIVSALAAYGVARLATVRSRELGRLLVIQPNVAQAEKGTPGTERAQVGRLVAQTRAAVAEATAPSAVVWPETALNGFLAEFPDWRDSLRAVVRAARAPVVTGVVDLDILGGGRFRMYNAALLVGANGVVDTVQRYHKEVLVPMTEAIPFARFAPFMTDAATGFGRGSDQSPLDLGFARAGVVICYESAFSYLGRGSRRRGADLLLVLTNDARLGAAVAPWQHLAHLRLRAIELRVGAVQSANSGPSAYVDPLGRLHAPTALYVAASPTYAVETTSVVTPYVRFGDWVGTSSAVAALGLLLTAAAARGRQAR